MSVQENLEGTPVLPRPVFEADECKGCGRCVSACPKKCLCLSSRLNSRGVKPAHYVGEGCTGCAICFYNCPEPYVITIEKP
jgi:NAD-dependent dihydropyrimidine dehydrogenase PreA subunit